ncbi:MAG: type II toxin-antitoxin system RelE/ParE family toxin [Acidobacteriia bacterium]|nr:type II toxin-antitoxin system RelE/ParE family toxin [Terriglobia bacterium]
MRYQIDYTHAALRALRKLDPFIRRKVFEDIERLEENPRPPGVEKLQSKEKLYRVHVGPGRNYRVVYQILDKVLLILVVAVGDRKEIYRHLTQRPECAFGARAGQEADMRQLNRAARKVFHTPSGGHLDAEGKRFTTTRGWITG